ncbi:MAG: ABC transporter ATP-binding protein [Patescibacteria group bacterium]
MHSPRVIEVTNLIKKYKKANKNAVDGVSFYVEKGSFFSLLGPNGAGKTTTLSILNTTLSKTSGQVELAGFDLEKSPDMVRKNIGVIFQNPSLDINLTAEENVRFHANIYGLYSYRPTFSMMPEEYKSRVMDLANVLGIKEEIFQPVKSLSGGMKRKLEIIRGLMHKPKILFLDEPTTGLDPLSRRHLWEYLQKIREEEKVTIFLTTHYLEEAESSDYLAIIKDGKIVSKGTPTEIKNALIKEYLIFDAENRNQLEKELIDKNIDFKGTGPFKVQLNGNTGQSIIKNLDTKLSLLDINRPTLEEAYLQIIGAGENE